MARNDDWLGWTTLDIDGVTLHIVRAHSSRGPDPYRYYVAARTRKEAVDHLREYGMHGFKFRKERNQGVADEDARLCALHPGVVMRRHIDAVGEELEVAPPP